MNSPSTNQFENLLRECGMNWILVDADDQDAMLVSLAEKLADVDGEIRLRFGNEIPGLSIQALVDSYAISPSRVKAILQVLPNTSLEMLVMAWRLAGGMEIKRLSVEYDSKGSFCLKIELYSQYIGSHWSGEPEVYESNEVFDFEVLRHFGFSLLNDSPHLDGIWPLRVS